MLEPFIMHYYSTISTFCVIIFMFLLFFANFIFVIMFQVVSLHL